MDDDDAEATRKEEDDDDDDEAEDDRLLIDGVAVSAAVAVMKLDCAIVDCGLLYIYSDVVVVSVMLLLRCVL